MAILSRNSQAAVKRDQCGCGCSALPARLGIRGEWSILPAIILVMLPKCPLCLMAWIGLLGSVEIGSRARSIWGIPLTIGLLSFAIGWLAQQSLRDRNWRRTLVGLLGVGFIVAGRCLFDIAALLYIGLALLVCASFLVSRRPAMASHEVETFEDRDQIQMDSEAQ